MSDGLKALFKEKAKDDELRRVLTVLDELLGDLPDERIKEFSKSGDFKVYQGVLKKYGVK